MSIAYPVCKALTLSLLLIILVALPAFAVDSDESHIFISGFNAYQKKEYAAAVEKMDFILKKYPQSSLRDMALFWLAKGHFKKGDRQEGAKLMAQFLQEYPESPLKDTVDDELRTLATLYAKGEPLPPGRPPEKAAAEKSTPLKGEEKLPPPHDAPQVAR